jgi:hypothetical protein
MICITDLKNIHLGDVISTKMDDSLKFKHPKIVINIEYKENENNLFIVYDIDQKCITIETFTNEENIYFIGNILDMVSSFNKEHIPYTWLGIDYLDDKILIDLSNLVIEVYDNDKHRWIILDESNIGELEEENCIYISYHDNFYLINLIDLTVEYYDESIGDYIKLTNNISLGRNGEYVFDRNNNLIDNK